MTSRASARASAWLYAALLLCGVVPAALADDEPRFEVRSAFLEPVDGVMQLSATLELGLSTAASEGLQDGVPVSIVMHVQLTRARRFLPDEGVADLEQKWRLQYHALSDRWLVTHQNTGEQTSWPSQAAALDYLAHPRAIPVIDEPLLKKGERYDVSLRMTAEVGGVPDSLKLLMFWVEWKRATEWYTWTVRT